MTGSQFWADDRGSINVTEWVAKERLLRNGWWVEIEKFLALKWC